ncbi:MAG: sulfatase-like hydrolase/transferase [Acidobacteria bacterium]|nr:sulfatase-like hydrolase/transferase [Acidobacteriota bacterium]
MYPLEKIQAAPFDESEMTMAPEWAYFTIPANWGMTVPQRREAIRAYYACISFMDAQVGKLLDALERLKLAKDTTIVFWGDNGYQLGEHGQWMKQTNFERAARIPLIFGGAGVSSHGRGCARTVELLDIYPTLAELCGLEHTPANLQGRSLAPLLKHPNAAWDKPAITQVRRTRNRVTVMGYSLRNERYRYTEWEFGVRGSELYDYQADPREVHNVTAEPSLSGIKGELRGQLHAILKARGAHLPGV